MLSLIISKKKIGVISGALLAFILTGSFLLVNAASSARKLPIYSVKTEKKVVCLTFDGAWGNSDIPLIMQALKKDDIPATFFFTGGFADKFPDDIKKLSDAGHEIGNHSDSHPHMAKMSAEEIAADISKANDKLEKITGKKPAAFRVPYGEYNDLVIQTVSSLGMFCIQWDVDSRDWKPEYTKEKIISGVLNHAAPGSIILMHCDADFTAEALPEIILSLKSQGFEFVTVSELIYKDNFRIDNAGKQIPN